MLFAFLPAQHHILVGMCQPILNRRRAKKDSANQISDSYAKKLRS